MFDDLDDDDVTDLIPDTESEKKEQQRREEQERRGRRMTISEVRCPSFPQLATNELCSVFRTIAIQEFGLSTNPNRHVRSTEKF